MSLISIFNHADLLIKFLLIFLLVISIASWSLAINKFYVIRRHISKKVYFENLFYSGKLDEKFLSNLKKDNGNSAIINIFFTGFQILKRSRAKNSDLDLNNLKFMVKDRMDYKMQKELRNVEKNIDWLATIGSISPFIGLFGTVWGIMKSFNSLAGVKTVTLAILAPSISEALLATALGLFVAIPAVIFYNRILVMIEELNEQLNEFITNFCNLLVNREFCFNI